MRGFGRISRKYNLHDSKADTLSVLSNYFFKYHTYHAKSALREGFKEHPKRYLSEDMLNRIVTAYNAAKRDQRNVQLEYQVGVQWQAELDTKAYPLIEAMRESRLNELHELFASQQRKIYGQSWGGYGDLHDYHTKPFFKYEYINTWYRHYEMYQEILGNSLPLSHPDAGNPVGMLHEGTVIPIEAIRHSYVADQLLTLVEDKDNAVICEIGAGQGGQAYATIKNARRHLTYILLDIPEILAMAGYTLCSSFPEKKILMYGEGDISSENDIVLLPNFSLPFLADESVDVFFNQRSFPEMERATVDEYLRQIARTCANYLYHINYNNHSTTELGLRYVMATEVVPDIAKFKLVTKSPWMFNRLVEDIRLTYIAFLYEKRAAPSS